MSEYIREGVEMTPEDAALYDKYKEEAAYYDRLQYVFKIKLNSSYGALTNLYFRFYDLRMGESTTGTGRMILRHQCRKVAETLDGSYDVDFPIYMTVADALKNGHGPEVALMGPVYKGEFQSEGVIYGDTDSTYFRTFAENKEDAIKLADGVAEKVNDSFQKFMQDRFLCTPDFDNIIKAGREIVSQRGIFVEKKRYFLHIVDLEGKAVDKLKVMGLDTKKTSLPKHIADDINKFVERFLKREEWSSIAESVVEYKKALRSPATIFELGLPKGISSIDYLYNRQQIAALNSATGRLKTHISGHVAAALHYNECLKRFNDKVSIPVRDGMKIRVFYLVGSFDPFTIADGSIITPKSIALPTDLEVIPRWFLDNFKVDIEAHIKRLVDNPLENIITAVGLRSPTAQSLFVDSILNFS